MNIFDRYVFKNLLIATFFVACTLVVVIFLTQSLRFLELVIDSGASSISFWVLTMLALPRFFEIILPLALMAATLFVYNRMASDSELSVVRSLGHAPLEIARPALVLSMIVTVLLWGVTMWGAPKSLAQMQKMRGVIKAHISSFFLREGVFNKVGNGLMVYVRAREGEDELRGIVIHDSRDADSNQKKFPSTIIAKRGIFVSDEDGYEVLVYDGSRQSYNPETGILQRLNFERYNVELPDSSPVRERWKEPDERTLPELLRPDMGNSIDRENLHAFKVELHRRVVGPFLAMGFTLVACAFLLLGPAARQGYTKRIVFAIATVMLLESFFLMASNIARHHPAGFVFMYLTAIAPILLSLFFLSPASERLRRRLLYKGRKPQFYKTEEP